LGKEETGKEKHDFAVQNYSLDSLDSQSESGNSRESKHNKNCVLHIFQRQQSASPAFRKKVFNAVPENQSFSQTLSFSAGKKLQESCFIMFVVVALCVFKPCCESDQGKSDEIPSNERGRWS
jgi:hypothetical protein